VTKHLHFGWALHNHQPVGNFPWVFEEVYARTYEPTVAALERHPTVRVTLHYTGPLLNWLAGHRPGLLDRLATLAARGQIELMTGGYYEPILPIIPETDQRGQIEKMSAFVRERFGYEPTGLWLAERVWEPSLPATLARAGVDYTVVDDTHFIMAGLRDDGFSGYYVTEDQGLSVNVFPIPKVMRESLPWRSVPEVCNLLRTLASDDWWPPRIAVMADDGEKFGSWPGTYDLVWERGWMDDFLTMLEEQADWLHTTPLGDYARQFPALGRVYLPSASYAEMMEWALPTPRALEYGRLRQAAASGREDPGLAAYLQGAPWRGFLAKYPESNHLHKKMLRVHHKVMAALPDADPAQRAAMLDELWQGQCNCAYWHGVFGGLYLADIRAADYRHLLRAENLADGLPAGPPGGEGASPTTAIAAWSSAGVHGRQPPLTRLVATRTDFDCDGTAELLVDGPLMNVYLDLREGGTICEWDWRPGAINVADTLARRPESYHQRLGQPHTRLQVVTEDGSGAADTTSAQNTPGGAGGLLAHAGGANRHGHMAPGAATEYADDHTGQEAVRVKEPGLDRLLFYDWHRRTCLLDHFLPLDTTFEDFRTARYRDLGDFANQAYTADVAEPEPAVAELRVALAEPLIVRLRRDGHLWEGARSWPARVVKVLTIQTEHATVRAEYTVTNTSDRPFRARFAVECNWGLLGGGGNPSASYRVNGVYPEHAGLDAVGQEPDVRELRLANTYLGVAVTATLGEPATLWRFPVETVSNSEAGFERVYQCSCTLLSWPLALEPGQMWGTTIEFTLGPAR
jgi:hypothetical protein